MFARIKMTAVDVLRYHQRTRNLIARMILWTSAWPRFSGSQAQARAAHRLLFAARQTNREALRIKLEKRAKQLLHGWSPAEFDWDRFFPNSATPRVEKSIILKTPQSAEERGVIFVSFEDQWLRLLRFGNTAAVARDYDLVLSPTWSPPQDLPMQIAARAWPRPLFSILSNLDDEATFRRMYPNVTPIPLLASHWVNPAAFPERQVEKEFDVVMLANFAAYKRHFALFRVLPDVPELKVLLLGRAWGGRTAETLMREAKMFGASSQVTIREGLDDAAMIRALQSAKVSLIMSMNEGSCVAVAESLFANVPTGLIAGANVGSRTFINGQTGRFLSAQHLAGDLRAFVEDHAKFRPRQWMLANGHSCLDSSQRLNDFLKQAALAGGSPWTRDLAAMEWRPNPEFPAHDPATDIRQAYETFAARYGIELRAPRSLASTRATPR